MTYAVETRTDHASCVSRVSIHTYGVNLSLHFILSSAPARSIYRTSFQHLLFVLLTSFSLPTLAYSRLTLPHTYSYLCRVLLFLSSPPARSIDRTRVQIPTLCYSTVTSVSLQRASVLALYYSTVGSFSGKESSRAGECW